MYRAFLAGVPILEKGLKAGFDMENFKKQLYYITIRDIQVKNE